MKKQTTQEAFQEANKAIKEFFDICVKEGVFNFMFGCLLGAILVYLITVFIGG